jgi:biopolymer transport protein ExbB
MNWRAIVEVWISGGWVMLPLALLALAIYVPGVHLFLQLRLGGLRLRSQHYWPRWVENPQSGQGAVGVILQHALSDVDNECALRGRFQAIRQAQLQPVDQRLNLLQTLVTAAPLLGLLGTVIGMFDTFRAIGAESGETLRQVSAGVSTALITTQTGLFIALPGLFLILLIRRRRHAMEASLARLEGLCLIHLRRQAAT